jgi:ADP-ribose pyrophosphatase
MARVDLFEAHELTLGAPDLTETEQDFELMWWPMGDAMHAAHDG